MNIFKRLFGKNQDQNQSNQDELGNQFFYSKADALDVVFGKSADHVGHAIISFAVGGAVDMYYYPNYIKGTGFATQELIDENGQGPVPNRLGAYELVAFTNKDYELTEIGQGPFGEMERHVCGILTRIGAYSFQAKLEPGETCELPEDDKENLCIIFDEFKSKNGAFIIEGKEYGLLLVIEVFRSEMEFAMQNGSAKLIELLKEKGHYPYSDLDREPVV